MTTKSRQKKEIKVWEEMLLFSAGPLTMFPSQKERIKHTMQEYRLQKLSKPRKIEA